MKKTIAAIPAIVACVLVSAVHGGDSAKDDAKNLQGTWKVVKAHVDGKEADPATLKGVQFLFKGDVVTYQSPREKNSAKFKLDTDKKPRHITTEVLDGESKGETRLAIYDLSGSTLKLCWSKSTTRPKSFTTKAGDQFINLELERVKE